MMQTTFGEKKKLILYRDRKGAYIIDINDDGLAVVKTPRGYFLPGGGIDAGETSHECIRRECIEETGYAVEVNGYLMTLDMYVDSDKLHPIQNYYSGRFLNKITEPIETDHVFMRIMPQEYDKMFLPAQKYAAQYVLNNKN